MNIEDIKLHLGQFELPGHIFGTEECIQVYSLMGFTIEEVIKHKTLDYYTVVGESLLFDEIEQHTVIPKYIITVHRENEILVNATVERIYD